jgi:hypothetical protein
MFCALEVCVLHKTQKMIGYHIRAKDGDIGHLDELLFDEGWSIRYLVVDTSNWVGGRSVLIAASEVSELDSPGKVISVRLTQDQIRNGPSVENAQIELVETLPALWIM